MFHVLYIIRSDINTLHIKSSDILENLLKIKISGRTVFNVQLDYDPARNQIVTFKSNE